MPELERWVLGRLKDMDDKLRNACETFDFQPFFSDLHNFAPLIFRLLFRHPQGRDLLRRRDSMRRRAAQTVWIKFSMP